MRPAVPSERNYAIYVAVEFAGGSLRKVAAAYQISPTRVQQIVEQARLWFASTTGAWLRELPPHLQPFVACRVEDMRLDHLYEEALAAWRDSAGMETITRESHNAHHTKTTVTRRGHGDARYLSVALRVVRAKVDNAARCASLAREHAEAIERIQTEQAQQGSYPCAPAEEPEQETPVQPNAAPELNTESTSSCDDPPPAPFTLPRDWNQAGSSVRSRKERKRRAKELQRFKEAQRSLQT